MSSISNFRSTAQTATTVTLNWSNCNALLEQSVSVATLTSAFNRTEYVAAGAETLVVSGLSAGTIYRFLLRCGSEYSPVLLVSTAAGPSAPTAPGTPRQSIATATSITWVWADNSNNETGFDLWVEDTVDPAISYRNVGIAAGVVTASSPATSARTYRARVRALHSTLGPSAWSDWGYGVSLNFVSGRSGTNSTIGAPTAPVGFRFLSANETEARFYWTYEGTAHDRFYFYVYRADGSLLRRQSGPPTLRGWTARALLAGTTYTARLSASNEGGETFAENTLTFTTAPPIRPLPQPPQDFVALEFSSGVVRTTFDASASYGDNVIIYYDTVPTSGVIEVVDNLSILATEYHITGLTAGVTYRFWAKAENVRGLSASSDTDDVTISAPLAELESGPSSHTLTAVDSTSLLAQWEMLGTGYQHFTLEISAISAAGAWTTVSSAIDAQTRSYLITGKTSDTQYWTRIKATNDVPASSPYSDVATATTESDLLSAAPVGPVITGIELVGPTSARVTFQSRDVSTTSYQARLSVSGGAYANHGSAVAATLNYIDLADLTGLVDYAVKIRATNNGGTGDSDATDFTTPPNGGGLGVSGRHGVDIQFAREFTKDDDDVTVFAASQPGRMNFISVGPHASNGPFAAVAVNGTEVGVRSVTGEHRVINREVEADDVVTIAFSGSGTGTGNLTLLFKPN